MKYLLPILLAVAFAAPANAGIFKRWAARRAERCAACQQTGATQKSAATQKQAAAQKAVSKAAQKGQASAARFRLFARRR